MKNKNITLVIASLAFAIKSNGSYARSELRNNNYFKRDNYYIGFSGVNNYYDLLGSHDIAINVSKADIPIPIIGNLSLSVLGGGIETGYNMKFKNNIMIGLGFSYIYTYYNIRHFDKTSSSVKELDFYKKLVEVVLTSFFQSINGHRIGLDASVGYLFENKVTLYAGGIISYNPGKPQNVIPKFEDEKGKMMIPGFNKKFTSDFGLGFKLGTDIKLTEHLSFNISYRMTWFNTTNDYKEYVKFINDLLQRKNGDSEPKIKIKTLGFADVDKMITVGIRYNF